MTGVSSERRRRAKLFSDLRLPAGSVAGTIPLAVSRILYLQAVEQAEANVIQLKIGAVR
jgi:hypothetical protein